MSVRETKNISNFLGEVNRLHLKKTCLKYKFEQKKLGNILTLSQVSDWAVKTYKERSDDTLHDVETEWKGKVYVQKNVYAIELNDPVVV